MQIITTLISSPPDQCLYVKNNKRCFPPPQLRFPNMVEVGNIDQLATYLYLFAHPGFISSNAPHRSNVPYSSLPSFVSGYCFGCETPNSINGILRKKHKEMAGCDSGLRNSRLVLLIKRLMSNKQEWRPSEKCSVQPSPLRPIVFRFMSAFLEPVYPC